ncbi:glycosyltransferase [Aliirhizobium terrae]|uniref:glycosyltransferase n=1 Tax=Terrirhizobium terrae TaxID=2926709 RepID=UPI0025767C03|nr:glycosyltransferase [Rhizobium sp. CC-CFT758]WJH39061.1 glycosyltransferase [Rhizobium sp. CC-CFT758]
MYIRTNAELFQETADCVIEELEALDEWVILANGPVPSDVDDILHALNEHDKIRVLRCPVNLGIHGGTRECLDAAKADFLMVLDADDLLKRGSVATIREAISADKDAQIFYTDEDLLIGGKFVHPFYRPDYDPAQIRAHSFIWHAVIFNRNTALELGTFTNGDAEYAQDWDNILRFELAGYHAVHIPEVVYHWRQHSHSLSNSGATFEGSIKSVRNSLNMIRLAQTDPDNFEVAKFPGDMGSPDFFIRRLPKNVPDIFGVRLGEGSMTGIDFLTESDELLVSRGASGARALADRLASVTQDIVAMIGPGVDLVSENNILHGLRHLEMIDTAVAVCGPVARKNGSIVRGAGVYTSPTMIADPFVGQSFLHRGSEMLSMLKPVCVGAPNVDLILVDRQFLVEALDRAPETLPLRSLGIWMGLLAEQRGCIRYMNPCLGDS